MVSARFSLSFWKTAPWFHWHSEELKWKVSQQLQDPAGQSTGPLGVFWSSHISPGHFQGPGTMRVLVLGHNLWSGLWYATVSDGGTRSVSFLPGTLETSVHREEEEEQVRQVTSQPKNIKITLNILLMGHFIGISTWATWWVTETHKWNVSNFKKHYLLLSSLLIKWCQFKLKYFLKNVGGSPRDTSCWKKTKWTPENKVLLERNVFNPWLTNVPNGFLTPLNAMAKS